MGTYDKPGSYYVDFGDKSELDPPYYTNQIPMSQNNTGFAYQCTWLINDRMRQICGFRMESLASGWGNGGEIWKTAQRLGFPVYNAQQALEKRGTLAGFIISFEAGVKKNYGTHTAVVESYDKESKTAWVSELWGSVADGVVHLVKYSTAELFHPDMHYVDFSKVGMTAGDTMTADDVRKIIAEHKAARTYNKVSELPFGGDTVQKLIDKGIIKGVDSAGNLGISYDMLRILIVVARAKGLN